MRPGLYAIVDLDALAGRDPTKFVDAVLAAGAIAALQLRAKHVPAEWFHGLAQVVGSRCKRAGVPFFVNDRPDVAWLANADGVHVGADDLAIRDVGRLAGALNVGVSTHTQKQFDEAVAQRPAYVAVGPIFPTESKRRPDPVVGLDSLKAMVERARHVPVVAIGGISLERADAVRRSGIRSAAVIGDLAFKSADELARHARALHLALGGE